MGDTPVRVLARKCAMAGLNMRDAKFLFEALYVSDAIMKAGGNKTKAAKIAGVNRETLIRIRTKHEAK